MLLKKGMMSLLILVTLVGGSQAIELRLQHTQDQAWKSSTTVNFTGDLDVSGTERVEGTAKGSVNIGMDQKVLEVSADKETTIKNSLSGFKASVDASMNVGEGTQTYSVNVDDKGGKMVQNGKEETIPAEAIADIQQRMKSQTWKTRINPLGGTVGLALESGQMSQEDTQGMQELSESLTKFLQQSALLPEKDVQIGDTWDNLLNVKELTTELSKVNPMLSAFTNLGIDDVKTTNTLREVHNESGSEIAVLGATTKFTWNDGSIPLGPISLSVKSLQINNDSIVELDNTKGFFNRISSVTTIKIEATLNVTMDAANPQSYDIKTNLELTTETVNQ